jgi:hypothetical protein
MKMRPKIFDWDRVHVDGIKTKNLVANCSSVFLPLRKAQNAAVQEKTNTIIIFRRRR